MGAYLSEPLTTKYSDDGNDERLDFGASSMQGWRVMQEDAHNSILDYDTDTSLFAVYDGHGGAEVAKYCSEKLPQFIKDTEAYKSGRFTQALEDAFLEFDATIATAKIVKMLKAMANADNAYSDNADNANAEGATDDGSDEDENIHHLCAEARMPLEQVIAKYKNTIVSQFKANSANNDNKPSSPNLRCKKVGNSSEGDCSSSTNSKSEKDEPVSSSSAGSSKNKADSSDAQVSTSNGVHNLPESPSTKISSSNDNEQPKTSTEAEAQSSKNSEVTTDCTESESTAAAGASSSKNNCQADASSSSCSEKPETSDGEEKLPEKRRAGFIKFDELMGILNAEDEDDETDSDETFEGKEGASSSDEDNAANGVDSDSSEEGYVESSEVELDEEEEDLDSFSLGIKNEPGSNSGCTAVVALLHNDQLFVANAGDSRCVVCRDGKAVDMSIDHKPEDAPELERIRNAGGRVSIDGRVNGGLNLSRAIGDLGYKQNKELGPKEQMITAFPDVKTLTINHETDSFMVLACDGIWNFMSSQNVVDFISKRLDEGREKLSQICEEMFDHCLAPNTTGDGTGCDNMTAVIIRFKSSLKKDTEQHKKQENPESNKRPSEEEPEPELECKRQKTENESVASDVTSSV